MLRFLGTLFLLAASAVSMAGGATDHWTEVRSVHFVVLTDAGEKQARKVASQFERMREVFHTMMPAATSDSSVPMVVVALKDKKGMQALEPAQYLAKGQLNLGGLFMRTPDKNYILVRLDDDEAEHRFSAVYHEYTHLLLSKNTEIPLWLNEGLAEFYQNTDILDKEVLLGQPSQYDLEYLRQNRMIPLATLLAVDYSSPYYHEENKGSVFYAQSWALTHYLIVNDRLKKTNLLGEYFKLLRKHEDPVKAAEHAFGDLKVLERALNGYVGQMDYKQFRLPHAVVVDEAAFKVRAVTVAEANTVRADVLLYNDRAKEAEALLEGSLRDEPKSALAHETMGFLKFRQGDVAAAKKWYAEAVELDSHSFVAHYYFAVMSLQEGERGDDGKIEASLKESIKLNPKFAQSYDALARYYAMRHEKLDEAHMANLIAVQLEPENVSYRVNTAQVLAEREDFASALGVLRNAAPLAKSAEEKEQVEMRITQMERMQNVRKAEKENPAPTVLTGQTIVVEPAEEEGPTYPTAAANAAKHTVRGVLHGVKCSYPKTITLSLAMPGKAGVAGKTLVLYSNDFYKIDFSVSNFRPEGDIQPCSGIEGMKALVEYSEVSDKRVVGQIVAIELSK